MLKVKKLHADAIIPTCANPGEDLGYDIYALEDVQLPPGRTMLVKTGIAAHFDVSEEDDKIQWGLLIRDRSSMAKKGIIVSGGVVDAGYRGEVGVLLTFLQPTEPTLFDGKPFYPTYQLRKGDKIAQLIPLPVLTSYGVGEVSELSEASRGADGFGSTGR